MVCSRNRGSTEGSTHRQHQQTAGKTEGGGDGGGRQGLKTVPDDLLHLSSTTVHSTFLEPSIVQKLHMCYRACCWAEANVWLHSYHVLYASPKNLPDPNYGCPEIYVDIKGLPANCLVLIKELPSHPGKLALAAVEDSSLLTSISAWRRMSGENWKLGV